MNPNLTDDMQGYVKPLYNVAEIQMQTAQKLMQAQIDLMGECLEVSSHCTDNLQQNRDMSTFFRVPLDAGREINRKLIDSASRQWDILLEARDNLSGVAETTEQTLKKDMDNTRAQAGQTAKEAVDAAKETTAEAKQTAKKETSKRKEELK